MISVLHMRRLISLSHNTLSLLGKSVRVVRDDTDVFVLLVHFCNSKCKGRNAAPMIMSSHLKERAVVDIRATAEAHSDIADDLLAIHRLSGADTVASLHGIGKATVIRVSKTGRFSLSKVVDVTADTKSVEAQTTNFICAAYGKITQSCSSMTECRVKCGTKNREEWCIISKTLLASTNQ